MKQIIILYLLIIIIISVSGNDEQTCKETNVNNCINAELNIEGNKCCLLEKNNQKNCELVDEFDYIMFFSKKREYFRAINAYNEIVNGDSHYENEYDIICGAEKYSYRFFTEYEKQIVRKESYCINYYAKSGRGEAIITKDNCYNAELLPSAIEDGYKCAYYEYTFNFKNNIKTFTTCYLFCPETMKSEQDTEMYESIALDLIKSQKEYKCIDEDTMNLEISISTSDGISANYDTNTGKMTVASKENGGKKNNGNLLYYLLLLFLIVI